MTKEPKSTPASRQSQSLFYRFDGLIKTFIPNFNVRAVLYMTLIFAIVLFLRIWKV
jgi:hypothetical protein